MLAWAAGRSQGSVHLPLNARIALSANRGGDSQTITDLQAVLDVCQASLVAFV